MKNALTIIDNTSSYLPAAQELSTLTVRVLVSISSDTLMPSLTALPSASVTPQANISGV